MLLRIQILATMLFTSQAADMCNMISTWMGESKPGEAAPDLAATQQTLRQLIEAQTQCVETAVSAAADHVRVLVNHSI